MTELYPTVIEPLYDRCTAASSVARHALHGWICNYRVETVRRAGTAGPRTTFTSGDAAALAVPRARQYVRAMDAITRLASCR